MKTLPPLKITHISLFKASAIDDTLGNDLLAITDTKAIKVSIYSADETSPSLTSSTLDLNTGYLNLTFDDFPNASTFMFDQVQLHNRGIVTPLVLSQTDLFVSSDGFTLSLSLDINDLNQIKLMPNLASDATSAYISISSSAVEDFAGNQVIEIPISEGRIIDNYISDSTGPELVEYSLDVNASTLVLTFSETIDASSRNLTAIIFQDAQNISEAVGVYRLTGGLASTEDGVEITITFSEEDVLGLQVQSTLIRDIASTFMAIESTLITDTSINDNQAVPIMQTSALEVLSRNFVADERRPSLQQFEFDLDEGLIVLTFSKTINVNSIDFSEITLQNQDDAINVGDFFSLTGGDVDHDNSNVVEIQITVNDLNAIKTLTSLAVGRSSTYISYSELAFADTRDLKVVAIPQNSGTIADSFEDDVQRPQLVEFGFDLNSGYLTLNFSEAVKPDSLVITGITIASDEMMTEEVTFQITPAIVNTYEFDSTLEIRIDDSDLNRVKITANLSTSETNTFIVLDADTVEDYADLGNAEHSVTMADVYLPDETGPILVDFVISVQSSSISLTFSEAVLLSSFVVENTEIFSPSNMSYYKLSSVNLPMQTLDGNGNPTSPQVIIIPLDIADVMVINNFPDANELRITNATVTDYNMNHLQPVGDIIGGGGELDTFPPVVVYISFSANDGLVSITFTEPVNVDRFDVSKLSLRSSTDSSAEVLQLTSGLQTTTNSSNVIIQLSTEQLNSIKAISGFATERSNTYVSILSGAAEDVNGNVIDTVVRQVNDLIPDETPPQLVTWSINLGYGNITLTFDEPVLSDSINPQAITIQPSRNESFGSITLNGGEVITDEYASVIIEVSLDTDDINMIYQDVNFCTDTENCFISIDSSGATDVFEVLLDQISSQNALNVTDIARDEVNPHITGFVELDITNATLTLTFSETVNSSSLNVTALTLQNFYVSGGNRFDSFRLTGGSTMSANSAEIVIDLTIDDLNSLKARIGESDLCSGQQTCYVRADTGLIFDMSHNPNDALVDPSIPSLEGALASYIEDTLRPNLVNYTIDLTDGILYLTFDETIDHDSFDSDFIAIQGKKDSIEVIQLDPIELRLVTTDYNTVIEFFLSSDDLIHLKENTAVATSINDTFLSLTRETVQDINRLDVVAINKSDALPAGDYIQDSIAPELIEFTLLDMNEGTMALEFNEPVLPTSVNYTGITIQSSTSGIGSNVTLTGGFATLGDLSTMLVITFSPEDIRDIKVEDDLGRDVINSYISFTSEAFADAAGNPVVPVEQGERAQDYTSDTDRPTLLNYEVDMNRGVLTLTFDDAVEPMSFRPNEITFQSTEAASESTFFYTLTGFGDEIKTTNFYQLNFTFSEDDFNNIKAVDGLLTSLDNTYLSATSLALTDLFNNPMESVVETQAQNTAEFFEDVTNPELEDFQINLGIGALIFTFSETVNIHTFQPQELILQNASNASSEVTINITLSPDGYSDPDIAAVMFTYYLDNEDINFIKEEMETIGSFANNTFLALSSFAIRDMNSNEVVEISIENAKMATNHTPDGTPPILQDFTFDLNTGVLELSFDESVSASSLMPISFFFLDSQSDTAVRYTFKSGVVLSEDGPVISLTLNQTDLDNINSQKSLAVSTESTYIAYYANAIQDLSGNSISLRPATDAIIAADLFPDITLPELDAFELDMNDGKLILTFSETVNGSSLNVSGIVLQSVKNAQVSSLTADPRRLHGGVEITPDCGPILTVSLAQSDLTFLQLSEEIGTTESNTYLTIEPGAVSDPADNPVEPIFLNNALQAQTVYADERSPSLLNFTFDLNSGALKLTFSEVVFVDTIIPSQFTLQSQMFRIPPYLQLSGGEINSTSGTDIDLILINSDLNSIKEIFNFGTNITNTFLSFSSTAVQDSNNNEILAIGFNTARQAEDFIDDKTGPLLVGFDTFTIYGGLQFVLHFSETVDAATLNVHNITLQTNSTGGLNHTLTTASVVPGISENVDVFVDVSDAEEILRLPPLGQTAETTYMTLPDNAIYDVSGNPLLAIPSASAVMAQNISADFVPPELESFLLDLTGGSDGYLLLTFSEGINSTMVDVTQLIIQNGSSGPIESVQLSNDSEAVRITDTILQISLSQTDSNEIKSLTNLAVSQETTYVSFGYSFVMDFAGISNNPLPSDEGKGADEYEPDRIRPRLLGFTLSLSDNSVTLTFSETVNYSRLMPELITFQNSQMLNTETEYVELSGGNLLTTDYGPIILFELDDGDKDDIRQFENLAISSMTTFITIASDGIYDMNDNRLIPITSRKALMATNYIGDGIRPTLMEYTLDLNLEQITLTFDETINASTVNVTQITLQSSSMAPTVDYTLTTSRVIYNSRPEIVIQLSFEDVNEIKRQDMLCTFDSVDNCYLSLSENSSYDMVGHGMHEFTPTAPNIFINDTTSPELIQFSSFNLSSNEISLEFSETINASSFEPEYVILQSLHDRPSSMHNITDATVTSNDTHILTFVLSATDILAIKEDEELCTNRGDCYILFPSDTLRDMSGNLVKSVMEAVPGFIVDRYTADTEPPMYVTSELNLEENALIVSFDEPVDITSVDVTKISLHNMEVNSTISYTLTGYEHIDQENAYSVTIYFTTSDIIQIKSLEDLAIMTYIRFDVNAVFDVSENALETCIHLVPLIEPDKTPPIATYVKIDLSQSLIVLTFLEPLRLSVDGPKLAICPSELEQDCVQYLTNDTSITEEILDSTIDYTIHFSETLLDIILTDETLATSLNNTYILLGNDSLADITGNGIVNVVLPVNEYRGKSDLLTLSGFTFDMENGIISLTFSGIAFSGSFDPIGIVIQSSMSRGNGPYYALTKNTYTNSNNSAVIDVVLSLDDIVALNTIPGLGTERANTYLTMQASVVDDTSGNDVIAVTDGKAFMADAVFIDMTPPYIDSFVFDLNTGILNLTFSEPINITSLIIEEIEIFSSLEPNSSAVKLIGGSAERSYDGRTAVITLNNNDLNQIKSQLELGTNTSNTFISLTSNTIADLAQNSIIEVNRSEAVNATSVFLDITPPSVDVFDLDMDSGIIQLQFSETVDEININLEGITLQDSRNFSNTVGDIHVLSDSTFKILNNTVVHITLSSNDLFSIQNITSLANRRSQTYLTLSNDSFYDTSQNPVVKIPADTGKIVNKYVADKTNVYLDKFSLDLEEQHILFTFSEVVPLDTMQVSSITLQSGEDSTLSATYTLQCSTLHYESFLVRLLSFCQDDLFAITLNQNLTNSLNTTYISLTSDAFTDAANNPIDEINELNATRASNFTPDESGPILESFTLDLNASEILLTFDEIVIASSFKATEVTLQSRPEYNPTISSYTLQNSVTSENDSHIIILHLPPNDIDGLVLQSQLATGPDDTYINISTGAVLDYYKNELLALNPAHRSDGYIPDISPPNLDRLEVNLTTRELMLTFSESVNVSTLDISKVTLENGDGSNIYKLTSSSSSSEDGTVVIIDLSPEDFNNIAANRDLYTSIDNSYVSLARNTLADASNNFVQVTSKVQASDYGSDFESPELLNFTLDIDTGLLTLSFSETVNALSLNASGISFVNNSGATLNDSLVVSLSMATSMVNFTDVMELTLISEDLNTLKGTVNLATNISDTFIIITSDAVTDMSNNPVLSANIQAQDYTPDETAPSLTVFRLDLDSRRVIFEFTEALNPDVRVERVELQGKRLKPTNEPDVKFTQSSNITLMNYSTVVIDLSLEDYTSIVDSGFCDSIDNCYVTFSAAFARDTSDLDVIPITDGNARKAVELDEDLTPPTLAKFVNFDFNSGEIILRFSEEVRVSSLNITALSLKQAISVDAQGVFLTSADFSKNDSSTVLISLSSEDLNAIKSEEILCRQGLSCFVRFTADFIQDIAGNTITPVLGGTFILSESAESIGPDTSPPILNLFNLDLDSSLIQLYFDEVVESASLIETKLTFQDKVNKNSFLHSYKH